MLIVHKIFSLGQCFVTFMARCLMAKGTLEAYPSQLDEVLIVLKTKRTSVTVS